MCNRSATAARVRGASRPLLGSRDGRAILCSRRLRSRRDRRGARARRARALRARAARLALRARSHAACDGRRSQASRTPPRCWRDAGAGTVGIRRSSQSAVVGKGRRGGAAARRSTGNERRADADRGARRRAFRPGTAKCRNRRAALRHAEDGRGDAIARLSKARHTLPDRARRAPRCCIFRATVALANCRGSSAASSATLVHSRKRPFVSEAKEGT